MTEMQRREEWLGAAMAAEAVLINKRMARDTISADRIRSEYGGRYAAIKEILLKNVSMKSPEIAKALNANRPNITMALRAMEKSGKVKRTGTRPYDFSLTLEGMQ